MFLILKVASLLFFFLEMWYMILTTFILKYNNINYKSLILKLIIVLIYSFNILYCIISWFIIKKINDLSIIEWVNMLIIILYNWSFILDFKENVFISILSSKNMNCNSII